MHSQVRYLVLIPALLILTIFFSFKGNPESQESYEIFWTPIHRHAEFQGGEEARIKFLSENIKYPIGAREKGIQGLVFAQFIVDRASHFTRLSDIKDIEIVRGIGGGTEEVVVRAIENMPQWTEGFNMSRPDRSIVTMPIRFTLSGDNAEVSFPSYSIQFRRDKEIEREREQQNLLLERLSEEKSRDFFAFDSLHFVVGNEPRTMVISSSGFQETVGRENQRFFWRSNSVYATHWCHDREFDFFDAMFPPEMNFRNFVVENLKRPCPFLQVRGAVVHVRFIVESDGKITNTELSNVLLIYSDDVASRMVANLRVLTEHKGAFRQSAFDLVEKMPNWEPARLRKDCGVISSEAIPSVVVMRLNF